MWKRAAKYLLSVVVGLAIGIGMSQVALWQMHPSFFHEYHQIAEKIYARYLTDGPLPAPSALSASAQKTLSENKRDKSWWTMGSVTDTTSHIQQTYPSSDFMTFGLCWGGTQTCSGESQSPKDLIHNAELRADKLR